MTKTNNTKLKKKENFWSLDIKPDSIKKLDPNMKKYFQVCKEKIGFIPNVLLANSSDSERLRTFVDFYNRLMLSEGYLTKLEREMIAVVVSSVNKCFYCLVAHGASVREISGDPILGETLAMNYKMAKLSKKHMGMLDFTTKLTREPQNIIEKDRKKLRNYGFSDKAILEIIEVVSFFNMSNRIASGSGLIPNAEYHKKGR